MIGDTFMPEMHLKQTGFNYSACGPFIKNKERIQKFKETGNTSYIYKNELDKVCFQHDTASGAFKDLAKGTSANKVLRVKAFILLKILNMLDIKEDWLQWYISFLMKRLVEVVVLFPLLRK